MKPSKLLFALALVLTIAGCWAGKFSYYWNPANVTEMALEALETGDTSNWMDLFTSHAICVYGNEEGYLALRNTLGPDPARYRTDHKVSSSRMTESITHGESTRELYEITIARTSGSAKVFTINLVCHLGPAGSFCRIYELVDHKNGAPDQGGICDDLIGTIH